MASVDHVVGDMTDADAVARAMDGCDAALHAAAVVSLDRRRAEEIVAANPRGAEVVLGTALERGLDPVVYVSSAAALFRPGISLLHSDLPPANPVDAYGRSKAAAEAIARRWQGEGAPLTITYPGGVIGPPAGDAFGEAAEGIVTQLRLGLLPVRDAAWSVIDVRDVAAIHAAAMVPGRGPRRYMCAGHFMTMNELAAHFLELTGRRIPVLPLPAATIRGFGQSVDVLSRLVPIDTIFTREAMTILTRWVPSDDHLVGEELGVELRDPAESLADAIRGLVAAGRLSPRQAGRLA
jgi:nucleoside-diphosphate-sugar epimerase